MRNVPPGRTPLFAPPSPRRVEVVLAWLRQRRTETAVFGGVNMGMGVLAIFVVTVIVGTVIWMFSGLPWLLAAFLAFVLFTATSFWAEVKQRGGLFRKYNFDTTIGGVDGPTLGPTFGSEVLMIRNLALNPRLVAAPIVEILAFGPRRILDGLESMQRLRQTQGVSLEKCAEVITRLMQTGGATATEDLPEACGMGGELVVVLRYLVVDEIVSVSETGDRLWLHSTEMDQIRRREK